jgi:hypothetical protein
MALGVLTLLGAVGSGLVRLGWPLPTTAGLVAFHGPLMVGGFFGTVIGLERAVELGRRWAYAVPAAAALGAVALAAGEPRGAWLMWLASAVFVLVLAEIAGSEPAPFTIVQALGACAWLGAQTLWIAGWPVHRVVPWWMAFLVLTVAGERLDLTRSLRLGAKTRAVFLGAIAVVPLGIGLTLPAPDAGVRLAGAAMVAMAIWLVVFDDPRRTLATSGVTRFTAVALLSGYAWLGVTGLLALWFGAVGAGLPYDALLHAFFLGFVFSMIFGHAPIVVPDVMGVAVTYRPVFHVPLALLHASVALRIAGDCAAWLPGRRWGGLLNAVAIVIFFATMAYGIARGKS